MRLPDARELLTAWERSYPLAPVGRPLAVLEALEPEIPLESWAGMPLGSRDARLLELRELTFGPNLECLADCPGCHTPLEFTIPVRELRRSPPLPDGPLTIECPGLTLIVRRPTTADLMAAGRYSDPGVVRRRLFARCLESACTEDGHKVPLESIPDDAVARAAARVAESDPQADLSVDLHCPSCGTGWNVPFDIGAFFGMELHSWAQRVLSEVHELARAYGWSETDILSLSATRRQAYLELVRS